MNEIITKIGDHFIRISSESDRLAKFFQKNFNSRVNIENQQIDLVIIVKDGYGVSFINYEVEVTKQDDKILFRREDYLIKVDSDYKKAEIFVHDEFALKHALTNLYSSFIVYHNWGLLIHSSCVIEAGKAHIFAGQSGAGKSTAAKLSYPREILSDEATLVKITSNDITIYNSPFRSELEAEPIERISKLESIQLLKQSLHNNRIIIPSSDALIRLMDKVFFWPTCQKEIKTILRLLTSLVLNVHVYELHFQKNNTFWKLIS
ncbi:hypothetical protein ACT8ZR_30040 [Neobacillus sp. M.A.Huq-85]